MTVIEAIVRGVQNLPLSKQVEVALRPPSQHECATGASQSASTTHSLLSEADVWLLSRRWTMPADSRRMADRANGILLDTSAVIAHLRGGSMFLP
jgi:hypothetical protein